MGMTFNFYGIDYTTIVIGDNGAMTFTGSDIAATNPTIPSTATANAVIAPFWDDLNAASASSGDVFYYYDIANKRFIVEYDAIVDYGTTNTNTFQVLLYESGKIVFQYKTLNGVLNECTVGIENETGTVGSLVVFNAAYLKNNFAIQFQATPEWLTFDKTSGTVASGKLSDTITATCNAEGLEVGTYTADITVSSNDPEEPTKVIPVTFNVSLGETGGIFAVSQSSLSYGSIEAGASSIKQFTITNSHSTPVSDGQHNDNKRLHSSCGGQRRRF
jgi:hypothetical protein